MFNILKNLNYASEWNIINMLMISKSIYYSHLKDQTEVSDVLSEAKKQSSQLEGTAGRLSD